MASGLAVGVTVVGVVAIVGLLGLLGRYLGLWTWAWAWIKATKEEKVQLCRSERTTSGRSYLFDNDLDWIGLWPRTGSYKRFTNLDDLSLVPSADDQSRAAEEPADLPPQPLRPAPAPPPRVGGWTDSGECSPSPASSIGGFGSTVETPPEPSRPAPILDRKDSNRSLTGRIPRRDSSKELLATSQQGSPKRGSTNPFRASWIPPDESSEVAVTTETSVDAATVSSSSSFSSAMESRPYSQAPPTGGTRNAYDTERVVNGPTQESKVTIDLLGTGANSSVSHVSEGRIQSVVGVSTATSATTTTSAAAITTTTVGQTAGERMFPSNTTFSGGGSGGGANMQEGRYTNDVIFDSSGKRSKLTVGQKIFGSHEDVLSDSSDNERVVEQQLVDLSSTDVSGSNAVSHGSASTKLNYASVRKESTPNESKTISSETHDSATANPYAYGNTNTPSASGDKYDAKNAAATHKAFDNNYETRNLINASKSLSSSVFSNVESESANHKTLLNDNQAEGEMDAKTGRGRREDQPQSHPTASSSVPPEKEVPPSPDLLGSYDIPSAPPNTATYLPASPHTPSSRLAEVEARVRLLGQSQGEEPTRDTSQDWWPTEKTTRSFSSSSSFSSSAGDQGTSKASEEPKGFKSSLSSSVLGKDMGLSSVDEESVPDSDSVSDGDRTQNTRLSEVSKASAGGKKKEEEEEEEDESTRRVREYIASLSARLRQLPDENSFSSSVDFTGTPPASATFPATPPNSARTATDGSLDTPPNSASPYSPYNHPRTSTSTPPSSAGFRQMYGNRRASVDASPSPVSPGIFNLSISRRLSLDTPPNSADMVTATPPNSASSQGIFGETPPSSAVFSSTPPSSAGLAGSFESGLSGISGQTLKRAVSCDSVSSDTSVTLGELEDTSGQVTGYLTIQLVYDSDTADLEVLVVEGKELVGPDPHVAVDSYVRVFLLPDKSTNMQTRVFRRTNNPSYRERFLFALEEDELPQRSLAFYMYASDKFTNTLIGEAHFKLGDYDLSGPVSTTLPLTDMGQKGVGYGEIMFSLSYLPTAERLTVVVVKARSLQWNDDKESADPFVKVYVLQNGKKVMKKKTSIKKDTRSPVFNEAMIFSVPAPALHNIQLRVTVAEHGGDGGQAKAVGHVIVGTQAQGKALSHWNQMMSALRKPIGMWHPIRR